MNTASIVRDFAALKYDNSYNLGDNIQTLAALQYIKPPTLWIDRDTGTKTEISKTNCKDVILILNGWFSDKYTALFPLEYKILPISFHLDRSDHKCDNRYKHLRQMGSNLISKHLFQHSLKNGHIGCRDLSTLKYCQDNNIKSYFSGCLTLTLNKPVVKKISRILVVDAHIDYPDLLKKFLQTNCVKKPIVYISQALNKMYTNDIKLVMAKNHLKQIAESDVVITSRLHTYLPAIAFNIPVIFVAKDLTDPRFEGLVSNEYCYIITNNNIPVLDINNFKWENMPEGKNELLKIGETLKTQVIQWIRDNELCSQNL